MGLGVFAVVHAYSLGLRGITGPGPGLMPFLIRKEGEDNKVNLSKTSLAVASLVAYALFMESLGYLITTTLLLMVLLKGMGTKKWRTVVTVSILTSLITYFAFTYLRLRLPMGIRLIAAHTL
jgi:hypothetical protein